MRPYLVYLCPQILRPGYATRIWHDGERLIATFPATVVRNELRNHAQLHLKRLGVDLSGDTIDLYYSENDVAGENIWGFLDSDGRPVMYDITLACPRCGKTESVEEDGKPWRLTCTQCKFDFLAEER